MTDLKKYTHLHPYCQFIAKRYPEVVLSVDMELLSEICQKYGREYMQFFWEGRLDEAEQLLKDFISTAWIDTHN